MQIPRWSCEPHGHASDEACSFFVIIRNDGLPCPFNALPFQVTCIMLLCVTQGRDGGQILVVYFGNRSVNHWPQFFVHMLTEHNPWKKEKENKKEFFFCKVTSGWLFCYYEGLHCEEKEEVGVSSAGPWHKSVKSACCCCLWWQLVPFRNGPGEKRKLYCTWHCDHQSCWTLTIWEWLQFTHEHWWAFIQDANLHALQLTLAILFHLISS